MKHGQEAIAQYSELANALRQMNADWIVVEVEEVIARGKTEHFGDLSREEAALYESRLNEEMGRGIVVTRAKPNDVIGVSYEPHERLALLVDAVERVIIASELSRSSIFKFATEQRIDFIQLESPDGEGALSARSISLEVPTLTNERLSILRHVLRDEVLS